MSGEVFKLYVRRSVATAARAPFEATMAPKLQQMPSLAQHRPGPGDRVLRLTCEWQDLIVAGTKTLEVRRGPTTPGGAWLGWNRRVWARVYIGESVHILTRRAHELPYPSRSFSWPRSEVRLLPGPVPFRNRPGPMTWIPFVGAPVPASAV